jgi:ABC-type sugar transport system substrate-binding protein
MGQTHKVLAWRTRRRGSRRAQGVASGKGFSVGFRFCLICVFFQSDLNEFIIRCQSELSNWGMYVPGNSLFLRPAWNGVLDEARRVGQLGIQFVNRPVQALGEGDTEVFTELVESGVDGIILTAGNPKDLTPLIDDAEEKGIRVVCVPTDAPASRRSSIVCVEPSLNGSLAGELMGKLVPRGSKVAVVAGMLTAEDHRKKTDGFSEAFPRHCAGGKIVSVIEGHEDEDESFQKTFDLLRRVPSLAGLYANTGNCLPVCHALGARGVAGKIRLITTDLLAEMSPYFQKGTITAYGGQPHQQNTFPARRAPEPGVSDVVQFTSFPRNETGGFQTR